MHTKEAHTKERWQKSRFYLFASLHCVWTRLLLITKTIQCARGLSLWMQAVQRKVRNVGSPNLWLQLHNQGCHLGVTWCRLFELHNWIGKVFLFFFFFIMLRFNSGLQSCNPSLSRFPTKSDLTVAHRGRGGVNFVSSFFFFITCTLINIRNLFRLFLTSSSFTTAQCVYANNIYVSNVCTNYAWVFYEGGLCSFCVPF